VAARLVRAVEGVVDVDFELEERGNHGGSSNTRTAQFGGA
jgi:hypothetical protein